MSTVIDSGAQAATISTEHTLATITTNGTFLPTVDIAAMVAGDVVVFRVYGKARSTDTERLLHRGTYGPVKAGIDLIQSLPIVSPHHMRVTLQQTAGTGRTYPWAIYEV